MTSSPHAAPLPTQHTAWIASAAAHLAAPDNVVVFRAQGSESHEPTVHMTRVGKGLKRLSLIGTVETREPADLVWSSDSGLQSIAEALANQPLAIELTRVPPGSPSIAALKRAFTGKGLLFVREDLPTPYIDLDTTWVNPRSRFNAGRQSDFRRAERHAGKRGGLEFEIHEQPTESQLEVLMDEAFDVEARSWKGEARTALAHDHKLGPFFRQYARAASRAGILRLAFMRVNGVAVGMQIAVEWQQRFWLFKIGYDPQYGNCSPGNLLMLHTIEYAARRSLLSYEFMGDPEPWTSQWTTSLRPHVVVRAYPASIAGALAFGQDLLNYLKTRLTR